MTTTVRRVVSRVLVLLALGYIGFSVPVSADYCMDQCYPTCQFWIAQCERNGGSTDGLCSCFFDPTTNAYSQCAFPSCSIPGGGGGGGECAFGGCSWGQCPWNCE